MAAAIELLADAIVTSLNAGSFSTSFTCSRSYVPTVAREDLSTLNVLVVPRRERSARDSRSTWNSEYDVEIALRKLVTDDGASPTALVDLAEEIFDFFRTTKPSGRSEVLLSREWPAVLLFEQLEQERQVGCIQLLTFRGWRDG